MLRYIFLTVILSSSVYAFPNPDNKEVTAEKEQKPVEKVEEKLVPKPKELVHPLQQDNINEYFARQFAHPGGQYGLGFLAEPQYQFPGPFPRVQPQIVLYGPGGQGQPILINPGSPPGNFLVPREDPNVLSGNPQRPVFVAGYPKPAHIPPIEKDAEEIPTNPKNIPPLLEAHPPAGKPQKIEANREVNDRPNPNNIAPQNPKLHPSTLGSGQRFFILNGDQILPGFAEVRPTFTDNFSQRFPQAFPSFVQPNDQFFRKQQNVNIVDPSFVHNGESNSEEKSSEFSSKPAEIFKNAQGLPEQIGQFKFSPAFRGNFYPYNDDPSNEAIIVEANLEDIRNVKGAQQNVDSGVVNTPAAEPDPPGPSMAQAGPGAISLAGPGGVAGAAPKGTAIVGKGGLAVANPQATAVAGPKENEKSPKSEKEAPKKTKTE